MQDYVFLRIALPAHAFVVDREPLSVPVPDGSIWHMLAHPPRRGDRRRRSHLPLRSRARARRPGRRRPGRQQRPLSRGLLPGSARRAFDLGRRPAAAPLAVWRPARIPLALAPAHADRSIQLGTLLVAVRRRLGATRAYPHAQRTLATEDRQRRRPTDRADGTRFLCLPTSGRPPRFPSSQSSRSVHQISTGSIASRLGAAASWRSAGPTTGIASLLLAAPDPRRRHADSTSTKASPGAPKSRSRAQRTRG